MFDEVSPRYDLINDVLTVGNARLWRIATTRAIAPRKGMRVLDIAAGTGTSSAAVAAHGAHVTAADFSEGMLSEGRKRHANNPLIEFIHADATALPFADDSFDAATISYGLRNVNDPQKAISEMVRVVKPGGRIVIAEFSRPSSEAMNWAYKKYNRHVLPRIAGLINRSAAEAYKYLNESIEEWPVQSELARWLREAGLEHVAYRNLTGGIVALHRGFVPRKPAATPVPNPSPKAAAKPAAQATTKPAAETPTATQAESTVQKPATKKPAAQKSATQKPATKKPAAPKPAANKPAAQKPAVKKPAAKTPAAATKPKAATPKPQAAKPKTSSTSPKKSTPQASTRAKATPKKPDANEGSDS